MKAVVQALNNLFLFAEGKVASAQLAAEGSPAGNKAESKPSSDQNVAAAALDAAVKQVASFLGVYEKCFFFDAVNASAQGVLLDDVQRLSMLVRAVANHKEFGIEECDNLPCTGLPC